MIQSFGMWPLLLTQPEMIQSELLATFPQIIQSRRQLLLLGDLPRMIQS